MGIHTLQLAVNALQAKNTELINTLHVYAERLTHANEAINKLVEQVKQLLDINSKKDERIKNLEIENMQLKELLNKQLNNPQSIAKNFNIKNDKNKIDKDWVMVSKPFKEEEPKEEKKSSFRLFK